MSGIKTALIISPTPSSPAIQGNRQRVRDFGRALKAAGMKVIFLYYATEGLSEASLAQMQADWDHVEVVYPDPSQLKRSFEPFFGVDDWCPPVLLQATSVLFSRIHIDICVVNYVWLSKCLEAAPRGCVRVIDTHDLFGGRADHFYALNRKPEWFYTSPDEEKIGLDRADYVVAIQDEEADLLRARTKATVHSIGMLAEEVAAVMHRQTSAGVVVAGFIASGNPMNVHSIVSYIEAVSALPPNDRLEHVAAGSICEVLSQIPQQPFRLLGLTDTVTSFYAEIDIAINPMIGGTGLKIKSVEALAHGVAFVGTQDAMAGIPSSRVEHQCTTAMEVALEVRNMSGDPTYLSDSTSASVPTFRAYTLEQHRRFRAFVEEATEHGVASSRGA